MKNKTKQSLIALTTATVMSIPFVFAAGEPENVNGLTLATNDATSIEVSWNEAKDGQGNYVSNYRVYYGTQSVQSGDVNDYTSSLDTPTAATSYNLAALTVGETYYVSVTAVDVDGMESLEWSIESNLTLNADSPVETGDNVPPTVVNVVAADKNNVLIGFSEKINLPNLIPEAAFSISEQINEANLLEVLSAEIYSEDPDEKTVLLKTADQIKNVNYIMTASVAITDTEGNPIASGNADSGLFLGSDLEVSVVVEEPVETPVEEVAIDPATELLNETPGEEVDITPPEDIQNLALSFKKDLEKFIVVMNWTASLNSAQDLVDQILYQSLDLGLNYDNGTSLGPINDTYEVANLEGGKEYTFKIATVDDDGNESVGVIKSIRLPSTGFGAGFLVLSSTLLANRVLGRRRKKDTTTF